MIDDRPIASPVSVGYHPKEVRPDRPVHALFEERAAESPGALAVSAGGVSMTYSELNGRAEGLARHLRRLGIVPEALAALLLERSPELVVSALATLKAGGAYLPVDPAQPTERVQYILRDSEARALVTTESVLRRFPGLSVPPGRLVLVDRLPEGREGLFEVLREETDPESLAYVIYTSGSTGAPKGAELRHKSLSYVAAWNARHYGLGPGERVSMVAAPGFDASVWEMWPALISGASLHLPPGDVVQSPPAFLPWATEQRVTVSFLPTPLAEAVLDEPVPPGLLLRVLQTAGDRLLRRPSPELPFELSNLYGPTENTIAATEARVSPMGERPPHIGRPVAEVRAHVLGPDLAPVPPGAEGELCLGGGGVARGYRQRPDLTAERFIPDPFSLTGGERLYRTGDLVRWLPSGDLDFLGRIDHQVKIRGQRIELGEVEAALVRHPAVREAAVLAREGRLVGYVALRPGEARDGETLRKLLGLFLPEVMVPAAWVFLDTFPLTPNGKIDRKALAGIEPSGPAAVPPRTPMETAMAGIWAEVLGAGPVGATDDFFALGGHSLLASRMASRVRDAFGADPGVRGVFDHPTVAALAAWVERQGAMPGGAASMTAIRLFGPAPLSFAQQRLWFLERLRPGTPIYNLAQVVELRGGLSVPALAAAFEGLFRRHDALRTVFSPGPDGEPVLVVAARPLGCLSTVDLGGLPAGARRSEAERIAIQEARRPYDLERGPLIRTALLALSPGESRLFVGLHHIVSDGWSMTVLMRELSVLYGGAELPPLPVQYPGYAAWQRGWMMGDLAERRIAWWRAHLDGAPAVLELPADRPRPAVPTQRGGRLRLAVGPEVEAALASLSRTRGATLFMTLLAAFQVLIHRWTGGDDFVVGTPVAGRDRPELEGLIGFFVNLLPLRADLSAAPTFTRLLADVRETVLSAFAHQDLPFDRLVEELAPERDASRPTLVQVVFAIQDAPAVPELGGVDAAAAEVDTAASRFDLVLFAERGGRGLETVAEYSSDLFDEGTVLRILGSFRTLLAGIMADPDRAPGELPVLSPGEREQVVSTWNRTAAAIPDRPVHRLFAERAAERPDDLAVSAVSCGGVSLTYGELRSRSSGVARRLRRLGIGHRAGSEALAGLLLERSPELVVAAVATLEAGGAYLPIDPAWPAERVDHVLRDAGVQALLTSEALLERFRGIGVPAERIVLLDRTPEGSCEPVEVEPDSLGYVIYTSGSTGLPKGTELRHRGLSNLAAWSAGFQGLEPGERVSMSAAPGFDASVWEMWPALTSGASLHLPPREALLSPPAFLDWAADQGVTVAFLPTPLAEAVLGEPAPRGLRLRVLQTGGDRLLRRPSAGLPFEVINAYGPTECTVVATAAPVAADGERPPHIGRPLANVRAYVLDRSLGPVPVGVVGELCLGGAGVARGYRRRPDLTAERFVPSPFAADGERLYRTGDLARWMPSGDLEFLGRMDHQIKIRGHRIELGEIEAALARLPAVREAVVLVQEPERRLVACVVACVVPGPAEELSGERLRAALAGSLPPVMIPSAWVFLDALPRTANGKVDRKALAGLAPAAAGGLAPRTPVEAGVAAIWAELLGVPSVGVSDDLFTLGGHSLLAVRLVARVRERLGVDMPLRIVFEEPTVAAMAAWVERELRQARPDREQPLVAGLAGPDAPLSFAQQRLWLVERLQPGIPAYSIPFVLRFEGPLSAPLLAAALEAVAWRHEALRTTFPIPAGSSDPVQRVLPLSWTLPVVDAGAAGEEEVRRLALAEARRPFDLAAGPLMRAVLLKAGEADHRLLINLHHIVADGLSIEILQRELAAFYGAFDAGCPPPLPPLPLQYPDFAVWQRRRLQGADLERQLAYWRGRLASPPVLELPADRPRPAVWSFRGAEMAAALPAALVEGLERMGQRCAATPFMTLLAGFLALLHRVTGQSDLAVGSPLAGRDRAATEGLVGFFVNSLVLRVDLGGDPAFAELLRRVRERALEAYVHQDLPFEMLVAETVTERDLARNPLFQVAFALQDAWAPREIAPGLTMQPADGVHPGTAKFDLSLHVSRSAGRLGLWVEYATDLYDRATVLRWLGGLGNLLAGACGQGEGVAVRDLPLLSAAERAQVVQEWNDTAAAYPREATVHGLFEEQARRFPDRVVLLGEDPGEDLTWAGLDLRAERLAARLRELGVGPEHRVGLFAERSANLIAAILGILKAGGAYLPLDPQSPTERLAGMLADAEVRVLVVQEELEASLPETGAVRLPLGRALSEGPAASGRSRVDPVDPIDPENAAYVMFTSGSTGRPKGVAVTHRNIVRLVKGTGYARFDESSVFLQLAPVPFDASTFEIWGPLLNGGRLALFPPGPPDLGRLGQTIERHGVTTMFMTAGLFHQMVESHLGSLRPLRQLLPGGDVVSPGHLRRAVEGLPGTELIVGYGPTEGTTFTTAHPVRPGAPEGPAPIGRPIANSRAFVLDRALHPVPAGVAGQLYIAGDGLARGYVARPDLTAERFVPDPVGSQPGARLYATGDLARWRPDGVLEFFGRIDHQVKLRGFRIELGEIETALTSHPEVESAVVIAREDMPGDKRLVAYIVGTSDIAGLRALLELRLPSYMVPSAFVILPRFPLTANGKVDRRALPEPAAPVRAELTAPRTPLEKEVAQVWCEVLGVGRVWVEDSFWDLGGHSLLATRALARLADTFGVEVPLQDLFLAPTLGGFSKTLGEAVLSGLSDEEIRSLIEEEDAS